MKQFVLKSLVFLAVLGASQARAAVWQDVNTWSPEWEQKFADWVKNDFNEDIFTTGKYQGISTDCAKAVYLSRVIFSAENQLPFVIKDGTGGSGMITNRMSRFDSVSDPLTRLRSFMNYVKELVDTKTLPNDSFPVQITRQYVHAGAIWSRPRITKSNIFKAIFGGTVKEDPGHAVVVKDVTDTGAIYTIGSTVPEAVRKLTTTSSLVFMPVQTTTGLRNWMEPDYYGKPVESLPGYSLEQFTMGVPQNNNYNYDHATTQSGGARNVNDWSKQVQERLALRAEDKNESFTRQSQDLCTLVHARVDEIQKSEVVRQGLNGACMNYDQYDAYSTPSRDKRILENIKQMASGTGGFTFTSTQGLKKLKSYVDQCPAIEIAPGRTITLYDYSLSVLSGKVSSDPNDSFEARWGMGEKTDKSCTKYE